MKKTVSMLLVVFAVCFATLVAGAEEQNRVAVSGAGLLGEVVESFAQGYKGVNPKCNVVVLGATTGKGIQNVIDGNAQIAMATRKITDEERDKAAKKDIVLTEKLIGKVSLVVITNARNTVQNLTMEQLRKIFSGETTNWNQCGGPDETVSVTMRSVPDTGAGVEFQRIVLKGAPYASGATVMSLYKDTVTTCGKSFAIGYIPTTSIFFKDIQKYGVKPIAVKQDANARAIFPSEGVVKETDYPITIPFYLCWNAKTAPECSTKLVSFCERSMEMQKVD